MLIRLFRGRQSLLLENLALRQQLIALKRRRPRPSPGPFDKLFWVIARRVWSGWKQALLVVTPETVVRWHRQVFVCSRTAPFLVPAEVLANHTEVFPRFVGLNLHWWLLFHALLSLSGSRLFAFLVQTGPLYS
jgi:hypothetical protein